MKIWFKDYDLISINKQNVNSMVDHLGIQVTEITENSLIGTMPVDYRTVQPFRMLHGGASCVLAETLGSIASNLVVDPRNMYAVGQSINASHIRSAKEGENAVKGIATAIHLGRQSHVWEIQIFNELDKVICISRLTMAVLVKV